MEALIDRLLDSEEPPVRYKVRVHVLGEDPESAPIQALRQEILRRYDILFALKVMAEAGFLSDARCREALDLLVSKELPDGGWPAEERFYRISDRPGSGRELVSWGGGDKKHMNEWVTADALGVLRAAGRLDGFGGG
jgi:hypothetical protein